MCRQPAVCVHSNQVCVSTYAKEDLSSRTLIFLFPTVPNPSKASADFSCLQGKKDNRNTNGHLWDASKLPGSAFIWKIQKRRQVERGR